MAAGLSRRKLARYATQQIIKGNTADVIQQIAAYLIETHREREADLLVRDIEAELAAGGVMLATATTAHPLTDELRKAVTSLAGGETVHIREVVDPSVIGGIRVELPGKLYDATVRHRLESLKELALT